MASTFRVVLILIFVVLIITSSGEAKQQKSRKNTSKVQSKQAEAELRETDPPNFVRLLIMRLIYGIAAQMGLEERISGVLNGAFTPPNADYEDYGLGELGNAELFDV